MRELDVQNSSWQVTDLQYDPSRAEQAKGMALQTSEQESALASCAIVNAETASFTGAMSGFYFFRLCLSSYFNT